MRILNFFIFSVSIASLLGAVSSLAQNASPGSPALIFGADERVPSLPTSFPHSTIGRVVFDRPHGFGWGTATLVAPDLIVTNAHVLLDKETVQPHKALIFQGAYSRGSRFSSKLKRIWFNAGWPEQGMERDYAVAQLENPVGDKLGWMGIRGTQFGLEHEFVVPLLTTFVGYSIDFFGGNVPSLQASCAVRGRDAKGILVKHDCDSERGSSGGPLFVTTANGPYIVAINVGSRCALEEGCKNGGQYNSGSSNLAVPSIQFFDLFQKALREKESVTVAGF